MKISYLAFVILIIVLFIGGLFVVFQKSPILPNNQLISDHECDTKAEIKRGAEGLSFSEPRNACFEQKAIEKNNEEYCYRITTKSKSLQCRYRVAAAIGKTELCDAIGDDIQKNIYRYNCYQTIAINHNDISICSLIKDQGSKSICEERVIENNQQ